jgi:hypothetical protein
MVNDLCMHSKGNKDMNLQTETLKTKFPFEISRAVNASLEAFNLLILIESMNQKQTRLTGELNSMFLSACFV